MTQYENVEQLMFDFIAAVRKIAWESPLGIMNTFPRNCCTVSSFVLGHLLQNRGFGTWHIVNGSAGVTKNHDWLESSEGLLVDATPHQFNFGIEPFVTMGSSPLEGLFPRKQNIELSEWNEHFQAAYWKVVSVIDGHEAS
jgi:hypothetical protein